MTAYFKLLRPFNLTIIAVTQWLLWFLLAERYLDQAALAGHRIFLFILATLLIAGAGYVVNDIVDYQADLINKPIKTYIGRRISVKQGWWYYTVLVVLGLAISLYLAISLGELPLLWIYPLAVVLLYVYSRTHKRQPLIGNVVVSFFCAWVPAIILVAERSALIELLHRDHSQALILLFVVGGFAVLAFLANMARELTKDIEDVEGDLQAGYKTLPLVIGVPKTKWLAVAFVGSVLLVVCFAMAMAYRLQFYPALRATSILLLPLTLLILYHLVRASEKKDFHRVSTMLKILMAMALVLVIILSV